MAPSDRLRRTYWKAREAFIHGLPRLRSRWRLVLTHYTEQFCVLVLFLWTTRREQNDAVTEASGRRMLFVTYYSPPYPSSLGTQRLTKFTKYWARAGWKITLLTTAPGESDAVDIKGETFHPDVKVVRIAPAKAKPNLAYQGRFVPDDFFMWVRPAVNAMNEIIRAERPDVIVATVPPYSNVLVAAICAAKHGIPLVTDFRDPWTQIDLSFVIHHKVLRWINAILERRVLRNSQLCLIADDLKFLGQYFPDGKRWESKVVSVTNGYDEEDFFGTQDLGPPEDGIFRISYVGGLYDQKTFEYVIEPLQEWARRHPEDMHFVRFVYAGNSSHIFKHDGAIPCALENHDHLPHHQAIALRFQSHVQLCCLPPYFKPHLYSGKIFEMIRTPVPILAVVRADSAPAKLVKDTKTGISVAPGEAVAGASYMKTIFDRWLVGKVEYSPRLEVIRNYSRERLAETAAQAIKKAI
ncbi:MAG: glycosyltransferase [Candidatus Nitrotoga sp.]|nr:glycosyltransferase [Candidatus Nitrotoga sp.]